MTTSPIASTGMLRIAAMATLLLLAGCNGIDLGGPGPDVRKQQGPLTTPPRGVIAGTAL